VIAGAPCLTPTRSCTRHPGCVRDDRREALRTSKVNGIDYVEVATDDRLHLTVVFINKLGNLRISAEEVTVVPTEPGAGTPVRVTHVEPCVKDNPERDDCLRVTLDCPLGSGCYTLCIELRREKEHSPRIDPAYACASFRGDAGAVVDADSAIDPINEIASRAYPAIDYLARDYASIRQSILDRMAVTTPGWRERHAPDLTMTMVEALAYVADRMHYALDSAGTEAYLPTARRRISVRRHARLVDYTLFEGSNARAWVLLAVDAELSRKATELSFITESPLFPAGVRSLSSNDLQQVPPGAYETFLPVSDCADQLTFHPGLNEIGIHAWGRSECCLPAGSTTATLRIRRDAARLLGPGSVLVFEEVLSPATGSPYDADPRHRHVVRLSQPPRPVHDPLSPDAFLVSVEWRRDDALPFDVCVSGIGPAPDCRKLTGLSVARGNVVLVDHGRWGDAEVVACVATGARPAECRCQCTACTSDAVVTGMPVNPRLETRQLVFGRIAARPAEGAPDRRPAAVLASPLPATVLPHLIVVGLAFTSAPRDADSMSDDRSTGDCDIDGIRAELGGFADYLIDLALRLECPDTALERVLTSDDVDKWKSKVLCRQLPRSFQDLLCAQDAPAELSEVSFVELEREIRRRLTRWWPQADLLASGPTDPHFVVELEEDRRPLLRFGDGELGRQPEAGTVFIAKARVGAWNAGNVGAAAIARVVGDKERFGGVEVRNPLPAFGGTAPETLDHAKWSAPVVFRRSVERAITAADYASIAQHTDSGLQATEAKLEWMGSWFEAAVVLDELGTGDPDRATLRLVKERLEAVRRLGHDLEVTGAIPVPIELTIEACAADDVLPGQLRVELTRLFSTGRLTNGTPAYFHSDLVQPGQPVRISSIVSAALGVDGVTSVEVQVLKRVGRDSSGELEAGLLTVAPDEVVRIDDAGPGGRGVLTINVKGGR
jgi:hypothetical protein